MSQISPLLRLATLGIAVLLCACQTGTGRGELQPIQADASRIRFEHPDFLAALAEYAVERDPRVGSEAHIASLHGPESRGLVVALNAGPGRVYNRTSTQALAQHLLPEAELRWGASGQAPSGFGLADYRLFRVAGAPLSCVAFSQGRGDRADNRVRASRLVYGYFCRDELHPLTEASAESLIASLSVGPSRHARPSPEPAQVRVESESAARTDHRPSETSLAMQPAQLACAGIAVPDPCIATMRAQLAHDTSFDCFLGPTPKLPPGWAAAVVPEDRKADLLAAFNALFATPRIHGPVDIYVHKLDPEVVEAGWSPYVATFHRFCLLGLYPLSEAEYARLHGDERSAALPPPSPS